MAKRYYGLLNKETGQLMEAGITGKVVVTTHKMPTEGYKVVELVIKIMAKKPKVDPKKRQAYGPDGIARKR